MKRISGRNVLGWINKKILPICGIIISVAGACIAYSQLVIIEKEAIMAGLVQPIIYTVSYQNAQTEYQIVDNGKVFTIKAMEPTITIENGAVRDVTAFGFDGKALYLNKNETIRPDWKAKSIVVKAQVSANPLVINQIFYDYLFLYIEPVEGEPTLDLVCAEIDLTNGAIVRAYRYRKHRLLSLELDAPIDPAERCMLEDYRNLYRLILDLEEGTSL
jgi:hypothetical protein